MLNGYNSPFIYSNTRNNYQYPQIQQTIQTGTWVDVRGRKPESLGVIVSMRTIGRRIPNDHQLILFKTISMNELASSHAVSPLPIYTIALVPIHSDFPTLPLAQDDIDLAMGIGIEGQIISDRDLAHDVKTTVTEIARCKGITPVHIAVVHNTHFSTHNPHGRRGSVTLYIPIAYKRIYNDGEQKREIL